MEVLRGDVCKGAGLAKLCAMRGIDMADVVSFGDGENDIEFMKKAIQVLCSSTNPLGRSIEFVTDDLDSMTKEFEYWTKESHSCHTRLKEE